MKTFLIFNTEPSWQKLKRTQFSFLIVKQIYLRGMQQHIPLCTFLEIINFFEHARTGIKIKTLPITKGVFFLVNMSKKRGQFLFQFQLRHHIFIELHPQTSKPSSTTQCKQSDGKNILINVMFYLTNDTFQGFRCINVEQAVQFPTIWCNFF